MHAKVIAEDSDLLLVELSSEFLQELHVLLHVDTFVETFPVNEALLLTSGRNICSAFHINLVAIDANVSVLVAELHLLNRARTENNFIQTNNLVTITLRLL